MKKLTFSVLLSLIAAFPLRAQSTVTIDGTSGTNTSSANYSTTGGLTLGLGFYIDVLVVGGGGGGGSRFGGGGGAGGVIYQQNLLLPALTNSVFVGAGGGGGSATGGVGTAGANSGTNGQNSVFDSLTASGGGGGGGGDTANGLTGGSGGGAAGRFGGTGGVGVSGQGNSGGSSTGAAPFVGGGGGGASGSGGVSGSSGAGGAGRSIAITGSGVTYGGGGGGGGTSAHMGFGNTAGGAGGSGGGGAGGNWNNSSPAQAGAANSGGGGGGSAYNGSGQFNAGNGGSGVVIVRYQGVQAGTGGTVSTGTGSAAGYTIHSFTNTGSSILDFSGLNLNQRLGATLSGNITGAGNLTFNGPGVLTLTASNSFTGNTRVTGGTLNLGNVNALSGSTLDLNAADVGLVALTLSGQTYNFGGLKGSRGLALVSNSISVGSANSSTSLSGVISGSGGLVKAGTGTFTLSGNNNFTGGTVINAGTLATLGNERLADTGAVTVNAGATFKLGGSETIASLSGSGTANVGANTLTLSSGSFLGALYGSGDLVKNGSGTFTLSGTSAGYTGDLYLNGGTAVTASGSALNANDYVILTNGATFSANQNLILGGIDLNGGTVNGSGTITSISTITHSGNLNSVLGDVSVNGTNYGGGLLKIDSGTTTLNADNIYTGITKVSGGTLALGSNGSLSTNSSAQIASGATLDLGSHNQTLSDVKANGLIAGSGTFTVNGTLSGSGTITPNTVITGTHAPGNSPGLQSFNNNLTYSSTAGILLEFGDNTTTGRGTSFDGINVGGNLNFQTGASINLSFNNAGSFVDWNNPIWSSNVQYNNGWLLYQVGGTVSGLENVTITGSFLDANGLALSTFNPSASFNLYQVGNDVYLNYAVPEPSTWALLGLGALALVIVARRRKNA